MEFLLDREEITLGNPHATNTDILSLDGRIYNAQSLRTELLNAGKILKTDDDREIIIESIKTWGISTALTKLNGPFALIFFDHSKHKVYVARDRLGEKQLAYTKLPSGKWIFATQIKTIVSNANVIKEPNLDRIIMHLICSGYSPQHETFFKGIYNVPPAHYMEFDLLHWKEPSLQKYWDISCMQLQNFTIKDVPELVLNIQTVLTDAVEIRQQYHKNITTMFSGGLDSSLITMISKPITAYTCSFKQLDNPDLKYAKLLADQYPEIKLSHKEVDLDRTVADFKLLTSIYEYPLWVNSNLGTHQFYKYIHEQNVVASFNGSGADELWFGYLYDDDLYRIDRNWYSASKFSMYMFKSSYFAELFSSPHKVKDMLNANISATALSNESIPPLDRFLRYSVQTHLHDILYAADRLSTYHKFTIVSPFLDIRLVDLALQIPVRLKMHNHREKYLLYEVARSYLPQKIVQRKKTGINVSDNTYEQLQRAIEKKYPLSKSHILQSIFNSNFMKQISSLPLSEIWMLNSLAVFEDCYFS